MKSFSIGHFLNVSHIFQLFWDVYNFRNISLFDLNDQGTCTVVFFNIVTHVYLKYDDNQNDNSCFKIKLISMETKTMLNLCVQLRKTLKHTEKLNINLNK